MSVLAVGAVAAAPASGWTAGVVDRDPTDGPISSMAVSSSGTVYDSWVNRGTDDLWWARWTGTGWDKVQAGGLGSTRDCYHSPADGPSAAFDPAGHPGIASWCSPSQTTGARILLTRQIGPSWVTSTIRIVPLVQGCPNDITSMHLGFDPSTGRPAIAYVDEGTGAIHYLYQSPRGWKDSVISSSNGCSTAAPEVSLAFDPITGAPAVEWVGDPSIAEFDKASGIWRISRINLGEDGAAPRAALGFGPDGAAYVALCREESQGSFLDTWVRRGGTWSRIGGPYVRSSDYGNDPAIVVNRTLVDVASYDVSNGALEWTQGNETGWVVQVVDHGSLLLGQYPSVALSSSGSPAVSYWDGGNHQIKWARRS